MRLKSTNFLGIIFLSLLISSLTITYSAAYINYKNETLYPGDFIIERIRYSKPVNPKEDYIERPVPFEFSANSSVDLYFLSEKDLALFLKGDNFSYYWYFKENNSINEFWSFDYLKGYYGIPFKLEKNGTQMVLEFIILVYLPETSADNAQITLRYDYKSKIETILRESFEIVIIIMLAILGTIILVRSHQFKKINEQQQALIAKFNGLAILSVFANYFMWSLHRWLKKELNRGLLPNIQIESTTIITFNYELIQIIFFMLVGLSVTLLFYPIERYIGPFKWQRRLVQKKLNEAKKETDNSVHRYPPILSALMIISSMLLPLGFITPIFSLLFLFWGLTTLAIFILYNYVYLKLAFNSSGYIRFKALSVIIGLSVIFFMGLIRSNIQYYIADAFSIMAIVLFYYGTVSKSYE